MPENIFGWLLLNEAWALDLGPERRAESERWSREHRLHEHPERIETRFLLAVDLAGIAYYLTRRRDTDAVGVMRDEGTGEYTLGGAIADGLRQLMVASTP